MSTIQICGVVIACWLCWLSGAISVIALDNHLFTKRDWRGAAYHGLLALVMAGTIVFFAAKGAP